MLHAALNLHLPSCVLAIPSRLSLSQSPGFAFRLQQAEYIVLANWALDVANDAAARIVHELHTHLCHTTTRACILLECILNPNYNIIASFSVTYQCGRGLW